jgi:antitoxin VapB
MGLNIKDPEAHRYRREHDPRRHGSPREQLSKIERRRRKASVEELLAIADRASLHVKRPYVDHAELLYDEHGLPK